MDQRDHAFLLDVNTFIYMNRTATAFALAEGINNAPAIAERIAHGIHGSPTEGIDAEFQEAFVKERSRVGIPRVQSSMLARLFAEMIAAFEELGAFCWAVKKRKTEGKGIFLNYLETRDGAHIHFYEYLINTVENRNSNDPPLTLAHLLKLPPVSNLQGHMPPEHLRLFEQSDLEWPGFLHSAAKFYMENTGVPAKRTAIDTTAKQDANQQIPPSENMSYIHIIFGVIPSSTQPKEMKIAPEVHSKIKHISMVTENPEAYYENAYTLLTASLERNPDRAQDWINSIKSAALLMGEIAGRLLFLEQLGMI